MSSSVFHIKAEKLEMMSNIHQMPEPQMTGR
jgi:hypothetical protein